MKRILLVLLLGLSVAGFYFFDLHKLYTLEDLQALVERNYTRAVIVYCVTYVIVAALNLPGSGPLTVGAGAVFGLWQGVLLASFSSTIGATIAMLIARTLARDWVQQRFGRFLKKVNRGLESDGALYLFTLRMIPLVPFFVINPVFGLTKMPVWKYYLVSQIGMLPATVLYVNVGATVGDIDQLSLASMFSPDIVLSFVLIVAFPFLARALVRRIRRFWLLRRYERPKTFDANLVVIGAGSAGLVSAYIAATLKARVILIERDRMGGDCLNTGCVPSKTLLRSAAAAHHVREAERFGIEAQWQGVKYSKIMERVHSVIQDIEPNDSVARYEALGVQCLQGEARLVSPWCVEVDGQRVSAERIVLATGSQPRVPEIPGLDQVDWVTSDTLWQREVLPPRLLVLGGGAIGCELAQAFQRLGSRVTLVEKAPRLLSFATESAAQALAETLRDEGVHLCLSQEVAHFSRSEGGCGQAHWRRDDAEGVIEFDLVLLALGREPVLETPLLGELPFQRNEQGGLWVDEGQQSSVPGIYACGDLCGPYQFTHAASYQAWFATVNALVGRFKRFKVNYDALPWVVFADPEIAHVGPNEATLREREERFETVRFELAELDRARADGCQQGFVEVQVREGSDRILAATVVAPRAGELIMDFVFAIKHKKGLNSLLGTTYPYPVYSEMNRFVAGKWKREHQPEWALKLLSWWFGRRL